MARTVRTSRRSCGNWGAAPSPLAPRFLSLTRRNLRISRVALPLTIPPSANLRHDEPRPAHPLPRAPHPVRPCSGACVRALAQCRVRGCQLWQHARCGQRARRALDGLDDCQPGRVPDDCDIAVDVPANAVRHRVQHCHDSRLGVCVAIRERVLRSVSVRSIVDNVPRHSARVVHGHSRHEHDVQLEHGVVPATRGGDVRRQPDVLQRRARHHDRHVRHELWISGDDDRLLLRERRRDVLG